MHGSPRMECRCIFCAHPVHGALHIQCCTHQEVATTPPNFQRTAPIAHSFCEGCIWHCLHIPVTAPFCCDAWAWALSAQSSPLWQHATIEITHSDRSIIACSRLIHVGAFLQAHPVHGELHIQCHAHQEVATLCKTCGVYCWSKGLHCSQKLTITTIMPETQTTETQNIYATQLHSRLYHWFHLPKVLVFSSKHCKISLFHSEDFLVFQQKPNHRHNLHFFQELTSQDR